MIPALPIIVGLFGFWLVAGTGVALGGEEPGAVLRSAAPSQALAPLPRSQGLYRIPYADGTKVRISRSHDTHTPRGRYDMVAIGQGPFKIVAAAPGRVVAIEDGFSERQDSATANQCNNNYVLLEHQKDEWSKYSHLAKGSATGKAGLKVGDRVEAGRYLGDESDVGCAKGDHLHFEVGVPRATDPFTVVGGFLNDNANSKRNRIVRFCGVGVLAAGSVHEARNVPAMLESGSEEVARHGLPIRDYQCLFEQATAAGYEPVLLDMFDAGGATYVNAVFRPKTAGDVRAFHGLSGAQYQARIDEWTGKGYRPVIIESYPDNGVRYAVVFKKAAGPMFAAYHGLSAAEHQARFDDLTGAKGYRPAAISVVSSGGRRYTGLYLKADVGGWQMKSQLTTEEYQQAYDDNKASGRHVAYLNAYNHGGAPFLVAIWTGATPAGGKQRHGLSGQEYQSEWESARAAGFQTRAIAGYGVGGDRTYAASWRP